MIQKLKLKHAGLVLIILPALLIVFHICIFLKLIPSNIVWLGQVSSESSSAIMAIVSIVINGILIFCSIVQLQYFKNKTAHAIVEKMLPFVFWYLVGNTVFNLFSKSSFEVYFFTPILIILTICFYRIKMHQVSR